MMFTAPNSDNSDCDYVHMWVWHQAGASTGICKWDTGPQPAVLKPRMTFELPMVCLQKEGTHI